MRKKYQIILEYIEQLIENNELKQGERLPAIRSLAEKYNFNKATIIRAYDELESRHKIYSIPKSGYYLVDKNIEKDSINSVIDFATVSPDSRLLPYRGFNHCINRAVELYRKNLFLYGETQGLQSLRKVLVDFFSEYQIFTACENICITSGSQQALSILTKMPFPNLKNNILVEQPTYGLMHQLALINDVKLLGINRTLTGINLEQLEESFKNDDIKFFYTIPRLHNPLGTSYSEKEKKCIAELAEKYDVYIVEDDYQSDLDKNKKVLPIYYYDMWKRVAYVKSFAKTFMPGIRLGAVVLPEKLRTEFLKHKRYSDLNTSALSQGALELFINSGMYEKHNKKIQLAYKQKMNFLKDCIKTLDTSHIKLFIPATGFYLWIRIIDDIDIDELINRLKQRGVLVSPGREFFIGSVSNQNAIRLCISNLTKDRIKLGLQILFEEIHRADGRANS